MSLISVLNSALPSARRTLPSSYPSNYSQAQFVAPPQGYLHTSHYPEPSYSVSQYQSAPHPPTTGPRYTMSYPSALFTASPTELNPEETQFQYRTEPTNTGHELERTYRYSSSDNYSAPIEDPAPQRSGAYSYEASYSPTTPFSSTSSSAARYEPATQRYQAPCPTQQYLTTEPHRVLAVQTRRYQSYTPSTEQQRYGSTATHSHIWSPPSPQLPLLPSPSQSRTPQISYTSSSPLDESDDGKLPFTSDPSAYAIAPPELRALDDAAERLKSFKKPRNARGAKVLDEDRISPITGMPTKKLAKRQWPPRDQAKRKFRCLHSDCDKSFGRPSALQTHLRHHDGSRPFECPMDTCKRGFSVFSNLKRHMIVHPGVDFRGVSVNDLPFLAFDPSRNPPLYWIDRETPVMLHSGQTALDQNPRAAVPTRRAAAVASSSATWAPPQKSKKRKRGSSEWDSSESEEEEEFVGDEESEEEVDAPFSEDEI